MQQFPSARFVTIKLCANCGRNLTHAAGQQLFAELREIVVPAEFCSQNGCLRTVRCVHHFDILQVIGRSARGDFGERFAGMLLHRRAELIKRPEEVVVTGLFLGMPVAHRPSVDELVVENVILIGTANGRLSSVGLARVASGVYQLRSAAVDAEGIL
jgi:hypothetical protein